MSQHQSIYPSKPPVIDLRKKVQPTPSKTKMIFEELQRLSSSSSLKFSSTLGKSFDTERWESPRSVNRSNASLPPRRSMFTPSRLQEFSAQLEREANKPYWRCPKPSEKSTPRASQIKTVNPVTPQLKSARIRNIEPGIKPNVFSITDEDLQVDSSFTEVNESELSKAPPLVVTKALEPGFLSPRKPEPPMIFNFAAPVVRAPVYKEPVPPPVLVDKGTITDPEVSEKKLEKKSPVLPVMINGFSTAVSSIPTSAPITTAPTIMSAPAPVLPATTPAPSLPATTPALSLPAPATTSTAPLSFGSSLFNGSAVSSTQPSAGLFAFGGTGSSTGFQFQPPAAPALSFAATSDGSGLAGNVFTAATSTTVPKPTLLEKKSPALPVMGNGFSTVVSSITASAPITTAPTILFAPAPVLPATTPAPSLPAPATTSAAPLSFGSALFNGSAASSTQSSGAPFVFGGAGSSTGFHFQPPAAPALSFSATSDGSSLAGNVFAAGSSASAASRKFLNAKRKMRRP